MEWFKHSTGSHEDPDINDIWDEFGDSGYVMFFVILEIYGKEYNNLDSDGFVWLNLKYVARKCRKSSAKVKKFLRYCEEISRFSLKISNQSDKKIGIKIPKFIEISSNWTKRKINTPIEVPTEVPTAKEVEVEVEVEVEKDIYPDVQNLVKLFIEKIESAKGNRAPKNTESFFNNSYNTIEKLIRIDKFEIDYIQSVLDFCLIDSFWKENFSSLAPLRNKSKNGLTKFQNMANSFEKPKNNSGDVNAHNNAEIKKCLEKRFGNADR